MRITQGAISGLSFGYGISFVRSFSLSCLFCALCIIAPFHALLQAQSYLTSTGVSGFSTPYPAEMGTVDGSTGNLHLEIPLGSFPQRGNAPLVPKLLYDTHIWTVPTDGASKVWTTQGALFGLAFGTWGFAEGGAAGLYRMKANSNNGCNVDYMLWSDSGAQHYFNIAGTYNGAQCSGGTAYAADSSGFQMRQTAWGSGVTATVSVFAPDGTEVYGSDLYSASVASKDPNGNYLGLTYANILAPGIYNPVVDTLGRKIVNVMGNIYSSPMTLQVMNSTGGTSNYVITYATIPVKTNFGESGVSECATNCTAEVITSILLPDSSSYSFRYDCDSTTGNAACNSPAGQSGYYGTLTSMKLPSGATIDYTYANFTDAGGSVSRWLTSKFATGGGYWSYTPLVTGSGTQQVTVVKPDNSKEVTSFTVNMGSFPTQILTYDTDGVTLLSTVKNTWDMSVMCTLNLCSGPWWFLGLSTFSQDVQKLSTSTTLPVPGGSLTKKTTYSYDSPQTGNVTAIKEWKYQSGTPPTFPSVPDRATYTIYTTIGTNNNINHPSSKTVCNNVGTNSNCPGGGTPVAQNLVAYDGYFGGNCSTGITLIAGVVDHDDTHFGCSYTARGNTTAVSQWLGSNYLNSYLFYDTTGQVIKVADANGNQTTYSYADRFYDDNGADPPAVHSGAPTTNAYVTQGTDAIGSTTAGYYYGSGLPALGIDYNGVHKYGHYQDPFDRPTKSDYPIGWALNVYGVPALGQTEVDSYSAVSDTNPTGSTSCTGCTHTQALLDQLGRATTGNFVNNPAGEVTVNSSFDGLNRVYSSSHPHIGISDPNNVYEIEYYDGLGRSVRASHPDGQIARVAYGAKAGDLGGLTSQQSSVATNGYGFPVVSMDEAGKQRQEWLDGFGHVIEVDEPSSNTATRGTATITVTGSEGSTDKCNPLTCICHTVYDSGYLTITVNGFAATAYWGRNSTAATVANSLAGALNSPESPVTAVANGAAVTMTAGGPGAYSISFSQSFLYNDFLFTPASGSFTGGSGGLMSSPLVTTYTYDVLGNLTGVIQGAQSRSYQYDTLSRLTQEITPEAGKVTLSYGAPGALCSGDASKPCSRTAPAPNQTGAATVTTTYTYNGANQLTQKTHSDSTGTETYTYGSSASSFNVGRLITMTDPSGSEAYTYDMIGQVRQIAKTVGSTVYITAYGYNSAGELTSITYPSGRVVYYNYDNVGHLCQVATSASSGCNATAPYLALPSSSFDAAGRPLSATYGNGVVAAAAYSPQTFELTGLSYTKGTTELFGLNYYYQQNSTFCPTGNAVGNNGQIQCIADVSAGTGDSGRSLAFTYDQLGRLLTAKTTGSTQYPAWGLSWTYDRYGNRTAQTVTAGSGYNTSFTINPVNNRITSPAFTYDASGNVMAEPSPLSANFTYDGEECNTGFTGNGNSATYTCDGYNMRVKKVVTGTNAVTTVAIGPGGQVIAEYDNGAAVASPTREYLYGNSLLAMVTGSTGGSGGTIIYQHRDHLSPRMYTDVSGNDVGEQGTYPFGESWYKNNTTSNWVYTSYERDQESGNDYALARSYANSQGRFLAPDPLEGVVGDPQSWNRYAYVENDPINLDDPSGQGFWDWLGFGIADIFVAIFAPEALPALAAAEGGAETTKLILSAVLSDALLLSESQQSDCDPTGRFCMRVEIIPPPSRGSGNGGRTTPVCSETDVCAPQGGGGPGDQGTGNPNDGQGPGGGGTASPGSGSPAPGGGTISNPSGGDIWNECDACWRKLAWAGNFSAGAGEFLTAGLTSWINKKTGAASVVNTNSGAYRAGWWTGVGLTVTTTAVSSVTAQAVNAGREGIVYGRGGLPGLGRGGEALLNSGKVRFGWYWTGTSDAVGLRIGEAGSWIHWHIPFWHP